MLVVCKDGTHNVSKELLLAFYPLFASCPSFDKCEAVFLPDHGRDDLLTAVTLPLLHGRWGLQNGKNKMYVQV